MKRLATIMIVTGWLGVVSAGAAETKLEGLVFANASAYVSEFNSVGASSNALNQFTVSRAYFIANEKFSDRMNGKVVLETNTLAAGNAVFLKMAYLEWLEVFEGFKLTAGLTPNPWLGFEETHWKYRFVDKIQNDMEGLLKATNNGLKGTYALPGGGGTIDLMVDNGEGPTVQEVSKEKDVEGRLTLLPFGASVKAFTVSVGGIYGKVIGTQRRERVIGLVSYNTDEFTVAGSAIAGWDEVVAGSLTTRMGFSVYANGTLGGGWGWLGRVDGFDPDVDAPFDRRVRTYLGASYDWANGVKLALVDTLVLQESEAAGRKNSHAVTLNLLATF